MKKKPFYKRVLFWVIAFIVVAAIGAGAGGQEPATVAPVEEVEPVAPKNAGTLSKAEFDKIEIGMKYAEVTEIIGGEGDIISEGEGVKMYQYEGEGSFGANANIMFQGGEVINKSQFGLK